MSFPCGSVQETSKGTGDEPQQSHRRRDGRLTRNRPRGGAAPRRRRLFGRDRLPGRPGRGGRRRRGGQGGRRQGTRRAGRRRRRGGGRRRLLGRRGDVRRRGRCRQRRRHHAALADRRARPRRARSDLPDQHPRHVRRQPAGRAPRARRRRDHQLLLLRDAAADPGLRRLCRQQGRGRGDDADPRPRAARARRDRERDRARPDGDGAVPRRQGPGDDRPDRGPAPLGRLGTPGDIAEVVSFIAGPGRWVNGQILYVNGGIA